MNLLTLIFLFSIDSDSLPRMHQYPDSIVSFILDDLSELDMRRETGKRDSAAISELQRAYADMKQAQVSAQLFALRESEMKANEVMKREACEKENATLKKKLRRQKASKIFSYSLATVIAILALL